MGKKLLVVTAGTVAASVGQTLLKQMKAHPNSELTVMARYIDTAYLPNRNSNLRKGEWFHLSIDPRYMEAVYEERENYPLINNMLFPGLLPGTSTVGRQHSLQWCRRCRGEAQRPETLARCKHDGAGPPGRWLYEHLCGADCQRGRGYRQRLAGASDRCDC